MIVVLWWFEFCHLGNCIALAVFRLRLFSVCFDIVRDSISIVIRAFSSLIVLFASGNEQPIEMICAGAHCDPAPSYRANILATPGTRAGLRTILAPERDIEVHTAHFTCSGIRGLLSHLLSTAKFDLEKIHHY